MDPCIGCVPRELQVRLKFKGKFNQLACKGQRVSKLMLHGRRLLVVGVNWISTLTEITTRHHKTRIHQHRVHCSQGRWHPVRLSANYANKLIDFASLADCSVGPRPSATSDLGLPSVIHRVSPCLKALAMLLFCLVSGRNPGARSSRGTCSISAYPKTSQT